MANTLTNDIAVIKTEQIMPGITAALSWSCFNMDLMEFDLRNISRIDLQYLSKASNY